MPHLPAGRTGNLRAAISGVLSCYHARRPAIHLMTARCWPASASAAWRTSRPRGTMCIQRIGRDLSRRRTYVAAYSPAIGRDGPGGPAALPDSARTHGDEIGT